MNCVAFGAEVQCVDIELRYIDTFTRIFCLNSGRSIIERRASEL
jgi:hypothetical protein